MDTAEELKSLKANLKTAGKDPSYGAAADGFQQFLDNHPDGADYADLEADIKPMIDSLRSAQAAQDAVNVAGDVHKKAEAQLHLAKVAPDKATIDKWTDKLDAMLDKSSRRNELSIIMIGDLNSRINQTHQLASNLISSANQSTNAVVQNIKG
jgi:hypothetical protein